MPIFINAEKKQNLNTMDAGVIFLNIRMIFILLNTSVNWLLIKRRRVRTNLIITGRIRNLSVKFN